MTGMFTIRDAFAEDDAAIWAILEPVIREGTTYPVDPAATREQVFAYWFAPDKQVFVCQLSGEVVGTYYLKPNSTGPADHVANAGYMVLPSARGQGVGRAMGQDSFARARSLGYLAMQFNLVIATNTVALKLWRDLGMNEIGHIPQAFRHPDLGLVDAVIMYKLL
jgi:L-amino acid N-acyltransferase YncA